MSAVVDMPAEHDDPSEAVKLPHGTDGPMTEPKRTTSATDPVACVPVSLAVALADGEVQQRVALLLRELGAHRLGLVDAAGVDAEEGETDE